MNTNIYTPRTDELRKQLWEKSWSYSFMKMMTHANRLERELAEAINQRDVLRVAINNIEKAALTCGCCGSIEVATKIDKIINNIEETK
jgi:hypothetical protein